MSTLGIENIEHTNGTSALTVDTSGRVAMPKVPAFAVRGFGNIQNNATVNGFTVSAGTDIMYNWSTIDLNRDSAFDNTTGIYTVPVAGLYQIQAGFGYKSSTNYMSFSIFATSSDHNEHGFVKTWANNDNNNTGRHLAVIVDASVGQQFLMAYKDGYASPVVGSGSEPYVSFGATFLG